MLVLRSVEKVTSRSMSTFYKRTFEPERNLRCKRGHER